MFGRIRKGNAGMTGKLVWVAMLSAGMAMAQASSVPATKGATPNTPAFDVVSIRQNTSGPAPGLPQFGPTPDGYRMTNMQLLGPILTAYIPETASTSAFAPNQIKGLPDWVMTDRFDIDARVGDENLAEWQKPATQKTMLQAMLQSLLADRKSGV